MSNVITKFLLIISILMFGGIAAASAQIPGTAIRANIPNSFVLDGKVYPAGEYKIMRTYSSVDSPTLLVLQGEHESAIFDTIPTYSNDAAKDTELVFEDIGGQYFLSKIRVKGETTGSEIIISKSEMRQIAKDGSKRSNTVIAVPGS